MTPQAQTAPKQQKLTWDTRAWLVGILGGVVGGSLVAWANYPPFQKRLNSLYQPSFFGGLTADDTDVIAGLLTILVLPGLVSGLARRWTFLWGVLPLSLFFVSIELEHWAVFGIKNITQSLWMLLAFLGGCWGVSSGSVSLIRWLRVRAARRHALLLASYQAQRGAALGPQEGVWPPPPEYRE